MSTVPGKQLQYDPPLDAKTLIVSVMADALAEQSADADAKKAAELIVSQLVVNGMTAACLIGTALLSEHLTCKQIKHQTIIGFMNFMDGRVSLSHIWLKVNSQLIDIGTAVNENTVPETKALSKVLSLSPLFERCDLDNEEERKAYSQLLKGFVLLKQGKFQDLFELIGRQIPNSSRKMSIFRSIQEILKGVTNSVLP